MKQGFLAFVLSSVFLLAIVAAALQLSSVAQDQSYQKYRYIQLQELAVKSAFYDSIADAARAGLTRVRAINAVSGCYETGIDCVDEKKYVEDAAFANAYAFQEELSSQGVSIAFWCGYSDGSSLQKSSWKMQNELHRAEKPEGTSDITSAECRSYFHADISALRLDISSPLYIPNSNIGFSIYSHESNIGYATVFPNKLGVSFA
ncbi:MAG: hypothetical protein NTV88_00610 [Candidatus Micrarchaeota archaeon]|nr:hypothetical protein [Candidatus Micrarchaeota archaeon]